MSDLGPEAALAAIAALTAAAVAAHGHSRRCPRCGLWFLGKTTAVWRTQGPWKDVRLARNVGGRVKWIVERRRRTTTHRHLCCRRCATTWATVDGSIREGPLVAPATEVPPPEPAVSVAPPPEVAVSVAPPPEVAVSVAPPPDPASGPAAPPRPPGARRLHARLVVAGLMVGAFALAFVALRNEVSLDGFGRTAGEDGLIVAFALVALGLVAVVVGVTGLVGPRRRLVRALVLLLALAPSLLAARALVAVAWSVAAQRAEDAGWERLRGRNDAELFAGFEAFIDERRSVNLLELRPWFMSRDYHQLLREREDHLQALSGELPSLCWFHRSTAAGAREALGRWPEGPERDRELVELDQRGREVEARLVSIRRALLGRFRSRAAAAEGADPAGVAVVASRLEGTSALAVWVRSGATETLALGVPDLDAAWVKQIEASAATRASIALQQRALDALGYDFLVSSSAADAAMRLEIVCVVTPVTRAAAPTLDVTVEARIVSGSGPPVWAAPPRTFRVDEDPGAEPSSKVWSSLLERAYVDAALGVARTLGL